MVVGGDRREPAVPSGVNRLLEPPKREPFVSELHQRQVDSQIHESIVSDFARSGSELASPLLPSRERSRVHGQLVLVQGGRDDDVAPHMPYP